MPGPAAVSPGVPRAPLPTGTLQSGEDDAPAARAHRAAGWAVLAVVATAALGGSTWWATHPTAYDAGGFGVTAPLSPLGSSLLADLGLRPARGSVTLAEVTPLITSNTAEATVRVLVCDRPLRDTPPGLVVATAAEYCGRAVPVDGYVQHAVSVGSGGPTPQDVDGHVVVEITPTRAGSVGIRGARIRYRDGLQSGTQEYGVRMSFTSR